MSADEPTKAAPKKRKAKENPEAGKRKIGRPSSYTPKLADAICAALAAGKSLRTVCKQEGMPSTVTVFAWMRKHPEFLSQYARAKEEAADAQVEEMIDIADDGTNDWMEAHDKDGSCIGWKLNGEHVQRSKLRIDTRKWIAAKMKPKKYGDRLELSGELTHRTADQMTDDELVAIASGSGAGATAQKAGKAKPSSVH